MLTGSVSYAVAGRTSRALSSGNFVTSTTTSRLQPDASLDFNIYDGGLTSARVRQARAGVDSSKASLNTVENDLGLLVANAYYGQLRASDLLTLRSEQVRLAEEQVRGVKERISAGAAAAADEALPISELRNRQVDLIQAKNDLAVAANALRNTIGLAAGPPLKLAQEASPIPLKMAVPTDDASRISPDALNAPPSAELPPGPERPLSELQAEAQRRRPEVQRAQAQVQQSREGIRIARVNRLPRVDASLRADWTPNADSMRQNWTLLTAVAMPLFDAGLTRAQEEEARANELSAQAQLEQTVKDVAADVTDAYNNLQSARERVGASQTALEAAQVNLQQTTERYSLGASGISVIELVQAQVQYATAANSAIQAQFDYQLARVQLDRAVGNLQ